MVLVSFRYCQISNGRLKNGFIICNLAKAHAEASQLNIEVLGESKVHKIKI